MWLWIVCKNKRNPISQIKLCIYTRAHIHMPIRWLRDYYNPGRDCHVNGFESCSLLLFRSLSIIQAYSKTLRFVSFQCAIFSDKELLLGRKIYGSPSFVQRDLFCSRNTYVSFTCSLSFKIIITEEHLVILTTKMQRMNNLPQKTSSFPCQSVSKC